MFSNLMFFMIMILASSSFAMSSFLRIDSKNDQLHKLVSDLESQLLPLLIKTNLQYRIDFKANSETSMAQICDYKKINFDNLVNSTKRGSIITISLPKIFDLVLSGQVILPCPNFDTEKLIKSIIIGEFIKSYDDRNFFSNKDHLNLNQCELTHQNPQICLTELGLEKSISTRPEFLSLLWRSQRQKQNQLLERAIHPLELTDPQAALKLNFSEYILNPEYSCRRPSLNHFFNQHFELSQKNQNCGKFKFYLDTSESLRERTLEIHPSQIYRIDYFLADKGTGMSSRWGHSMLRIIICSPSRKVPGPECLNDVTHHLVASFRAAVTDISIDTLKGLFGSYASRMYLIPLIHIQNEYNRGELRNLISYPLLLTSEERISVFYRIMEAYWEYNGTYKFITNNCASETDQLLKSVLQRSGLHDQNINTPMGLRDQLIHVGLISKSEKPQVFWSEEKIVSRALQALGEKENIEITSEKLEFHLKKLKTNQAGTIRTTLLAHLRLLTDRAIIVQNLNLQADLQLYIEKAKINETATAQNKNPDLKELGFRLIKALKDKPQQHLVQKGYGIALNYELPETVTDEKLMPEPSSELVQELFPHHIKEMKKLTELMKNVDQELAR